MGLTATESKNASRFFEIETGAQLAGGSTDDSTTQGGIESAEAIEFDGDSGCAESGTDGAATAPDRFAREKELREEAAQLGLPA
ncbi:MAG: hypothetical protein JWP98_793 [Edaphobacter sp.]|nr:hypothetical protein [Edaphobacter sp.]